MPPEYILEGTLSMRYDVYSFGVTLLETISGMCRDAPARHHASVPWVSKTLDQFVAVSHEFPLLVSLIYTPFRWTEFYNIFSFHRIAH